MKMFFVPLVIMVVILSAKGQTFDNPEGSPCQWLNVTGTCVDIRRCDSLKYDSQEYGAPPICSFNNNEPIVCCVYCSILEEKDKIQDVLDREYYKTDRKYERRSPCQWLNVTGTCVNIRRCDLLKYDKSPEGRSPPICSFNGNEPIVCCIYCSFLDEKDKIRDYLDMDEFRTDRKYERKCFEYQYLLPYECKVYSRIIPTQRDYKIIYNSTRKCYELSEVKHGGSGGGGIGGQDALRGDFPHMALLGYGPDLESAQWLCGGSLISERFILTAGHCASSTTLGEVKYVALGMLKRSDPPQFWKRYKIKRFIPHPDYHPPSKYNDIALIETEIFVNLTDGVRPACLTHKPEFTKDDIAYATGWGALGKNKKNADVMQKLILEKFTPEECAVQYPVHRHLLQGYNEATQICYGHHTEIRDTCQGDSGGPLQKRDPDARYCQYAIIGVTSYGRECGQLGAAGIYTRVYHYVPWIESIVWP